MDSNTTQGPARCVQPIVRQDLDLLLELAASLLMPGNLPSVFLEDWDLPKSTPLVVRRKIHDEACKAKAFAGKVAAKLAGIHDRLSANADFRQPETKD